MLSRSATGTIPQGAVKRVQNRVGEPSALFRDGRGSSSRAAGDTEPEPGSRPFRNQQPVPLDTGEVRQVDSVPTWTDKGSVVYPITFPPRDSIQSRAACMFPAGVHIVVNEVVVRPRIHFPIVGFRHMAEKRL